VEYILDSLPVEKRKKKVATDDDGDVRRCHSDDDVHSPAMNCW
jgi:hypothetical protein